MTGIYKTEPEINREQRVSINQTWDDILRRFSNLQRQINILSGDQEVDDLLNRLDKAVIDADIAVQQAISVNNTATQEAISANNIAVQEALTTVSQTLVDVNKVIGDANTATTEANAAKQGTLDATAQAQTALAAMHSLITNLGSKGVWNVAMQYYKNNLAVFNGSTFIALQDNLGKTPPTLPTQSNAYWSLFAEQGTRGPQGLQGLPGKDGKDGTGVNIIGELMSEDNLPSTGSPGDAYMINGDLYVWQENTSGWKNVGPIRGPQGKSAYDLAVENGFLGTMVEWIETLKGIQGPQGPEGPPGPPADLTEINQQILTLQSEVAEHETAIATTEKLGHFKPDGNTITVSPEGVASAKQYTLPIAKTDELGGFKPDGTTITVDPVTGVAKVVGAGGKVFTVSTANRVMYVNPTTGDDSASNTGLLGKPYRTIERAISEVPDIVNHRIEIRTTGTSLENILIANRSGSGEVLLYDTAGGQTRTTVQSVRVVNCSASVTLNNLVAVTSSTAFTFQNSAKITAYNIQAPNGDGSTSLGIMVDSCTFVNLSSCKFDNKAACIWVEGGSSLYCQSLSGANPSGFVYRAQTLGRIYHTANTATGAGLETATMGGVITK